MYVCVCVCMYVCVYVGVNIKYQGCIQDFGSGGGGANWGNEKCRWGKVIRIIAVQMPINESDRS